MVKTNTAKNITKASRTTAKKSKSARNATRVSQTVAAAAPETDTIYILKLVLYLIIGSQWLRVTRGDMTIPVPIGLIVGFFFARSERFQIDRKLEYAMLLMAMFIGFWVLPGVELLF